MLTHPCLLHLAEDAEEVLIHVCPAHDTLRLLYLLLGTEDDLQIMPMCPSLEVAYGIGYQLAS